MTEKSTDSVVNGMMDTRRSRLDAAEINPGAGRRGENSPEG
jgi:hypothetical protein